MGITVRDAYFSQVPLRICDECARANGGQSPSEIHIATYTTEACGLCYEVKPVADITDWVWPWAWRRKES